MLSQLDIWQVHDEEPPTFVSAGAEDEEGEAPRDGSCTICLTNESNVVEVACGHQFLCSECKDQFFQNECCVL